MAHFRKSKLTEQRLEWYSTYFINSPWEYSGKWYELMPSAQRIHLDLGCGKGVWTTRAAQACPDDLFIGIDYERMCVSFAVERAAELGLKNVFFVHDTAHAIEKLFATEEIDVLHINFPTPFPRKKESLNRITDSRRLMTYRSLLNKNGQLHLKTDSQPFFDWTLEQLDLAGYTVLWETKDLHAAAPVPTTPSDAGISFLNELSAAPTAMPTAAPSTNTAFPETCDVILSAYEEKFLPQGAKIHALVAIPGPEPKEWRPSKKVSLVDYLPKDLSSIDYIPHGMQATVENMRNRERNESKIQRTQTRKEKKDKSNCK